MTDDCCLADLLGLNLHNFEDEVHNVVDKAVKEMAMEKMLRDLESTWTSMEFVHELHARTGCNLLRFVLNCLMEVVIVVLFKDGLFDVLFT